MNWVVSCTLCGSSYVYESGQGLPDVCPVCSEKGKKEVKKFLEKEQKRKEIVSVSTLEFPNRKIMKALGIVTHEHVFGVGLVKELDLAKFNGGISISWTEKVHTGRDLAIRSIEDEAIELGGNAVVGVEIVYKVLGSHNDMVILLVGARGTAVVVT
ncbi:MAG TPA: heavy metal-binding domain-containing protein [Thermodesulfobacteriota bacterium]|nr:heavy metal-binding domain-containing protein [Thermodesulfobacteriota bacterium]